VKDQSDHEQEGVSFHPTNLEADAQPEPEADQETATEAGELPMDIDEELTTAPTRTQMSANASKLADIIDDERPPAAPLPASPTPTPTSNDELSDAGSELSERRRMRRRSRRRRRRRSHEPDEEHTHHTQHLLNEMEMARELEEERKNELLANASKYSASTSSPAVTVIPPDPPEIIELDSNSANSGADQQQVQLQEQSLPTPLVVQSPAAEVATTAIQPQLLPPQRPLIEQLPVEHLPPVLSEPIVDTILEMEDSKFANNFASSLASVLNPPNPGQMSLIGSSMDRSKQISEEDSIQATRNLLEKLRKTKRKPQDDNCSKEAVDLLPPTPSIPSVFPFHNAADPEDIIHAQKEQQQQQQQQAAAAAAAATSSSSSSNSCSCNSSSSSSTGNSNNAAAAATAGSSGN